jgi:5-formyltetrahydrofolate cyclo-ligase
MAGPSPSPFDKPALRTLMRQRRRDYAASLEPDTRKRLEAQLAEVLDPLLFACTAVAAYFPMKDEVNCLPALDRARAMGKTAALPFFAGRDSRMTFRDGDAVDPGPWGILQPTPDAPLLSPDLLLIPLIAMDARGNRIGMGKGHYDRALPGLRAAGARLVGVGWSFQMVDEDIPADPWDVPLDGFASPDGLTEFGA